MRVCLCVSECRDNFATQNEKWKISSDIFTQRTSIIIFKQTLCLPLPLFLPLSLSQLCLLCFLFLAMLQMMFSCFSGDCDWRPNWTEPHRTEQPKRRRWSGAWNFSCHRSRRFSCQRERQRRRESGRAGASCGNSVSNVYFTYTTSFACHAPSCCPFC